MPGVGLLTFTKPLPATAKVIVKYTVEVDGLPVYTETYDVDKLRDELKRDEPTVVRNWIRRIKCVVCCRRRQGFSSCVTRCLADGQCCDKASQRCTNVE